MASLVFLLGGHDLEMAEIRQIADAQGIAYHDHNLSWGSVKLKARIPMK